MLIKNPQIIKSIFDLDTLFRDEEIFKYYIIKIFEISSHIIDETENKFGIIFLKKGINEYLLLDFRILILALYKSLEKLYIDTYYFNNLKESFSFKNYSILNDSMINLLFILAKKDLVYFTDLKKYYINYKFCICDENTIYSTRFNAIAIKYPTILKLFSNNKDMLYNFESNITRIFEKYKRDRLKNSEFFSVENFSEFQNNFQNKQI